MQSNREQEVINQIFSDWGKALDTDFDEKKASAINKLFNNYKKENVQTGDCILTFEMALKYGNIHLYQVRELEEDCFLHYPPGSYDRVSINGTRALIFFSDKNPLEPAERQSPFYNGMCYAWLKKIKETELVDIYIKKPEIEFRTNFAVWGFNFNPIWRTVRFGICLKPSLLQDFLLNYFQITGLNSLLNLDEIKEILPEV